MFQATKMLNQFPVKWGISDTIIPKTIMTDNSLHYKKTYWSTYCTVLSSTWGIHSVKYKSATYQGYHMHGTNCKYTRWDQVYEPEINKKDYKAILGYDTNAWYSYWPGQYISKIATRAIGIYWSQRPTHWRWWCQSHRSGRGWGLKWGPTKN